MSELHVFLNVISPIVQILSNYHKCKTFREQCQHYTSISCAPCWSHNKIVISLGEIGNTACVHSHSLWTQFSADSVRISLLWTPPLFSLSAGIDSVPRLLSLQFKSLAHINCTNGRIAAKYNGSSLCCRMKNNFRGLMKSSNCSNNV